MNGATCRAKPSMTPTGSFGESRRDTWSTQRSPGASGRSSTICARARTSPPVPSRRRNAAVPGRPARNPAATRIASTSAGASSSFFGENASMDGAMIARRAGSSSSHTNASRENT